MVLGKLNGMPATLALQGWQLVSYFLPGFVCHIMQPAVRPSFLWWNTVAKELLSNLGSIPNVFLVVWYLQWHIACQWHGCSVFCRSEPANCDHKILQCQMIIEVISLIQEWKTWTTYMQNDWTEQWVQCYWCLWIEIIIVHICM